MAYRQISRVFILTPPARLKTQLQNENEGFKEEAAKLEVMFFGSKRVFLLLLATTVAQVTLRLADRVTAPEG